LHNLTRARGLAGAILLALIVAACGPGAGAAGSGAAADAGGATIGVAAPADGAEVSIPFDVTLESSVPLGPPESGSQHAHLYFDTGTDAADYDIVYGTSWQVTRPLTPGEHTITAALANPDHSLAGPTTTFTVTVTAAGTDGASTAPSQPTIVYGT
jgi:hypothetical protein